MSIQKNVLVLVCFGMITHVHANELRPTVIAETPTENIMAKASADSAVKTQRARASATVEPSELKRIEQKIESERSRDPRLVRRTLPDMDLSDNIPRYQSTSHKPKFEGPALQVSGGYSWNKVNYTALVGSESNTSNGFNVKVGGEYGIPINDKIILNIGGDYYANSSMKFDYINYLNMGDIIYVKLKEHATVYVSPGYKVRPDLLVYSKLGFHHARGNYADIYIPLGGITFGDATKTFSGYSAGVGVAYAIGEQIENGVELQHTRYDPQHEFISSGRIKSTELMATMKFRF